MKKWLSKYFGFTKREYNGLLVLLTLLLLSTVVPYLYAEYGMEKAVISAEERQAISKLEFIEHQKVTNRNAAYKTNKETLDPELFKFDPNQIDLEGWQKLGLSQRQAQSILNYRSKGGKFFKTEDLQKMYAISPQKYAELKPFVEIATGEKPTHTISARPILPKKEKVIIEINGADTLQLDQIKGIGMAFARRIVKYRDRLGGFHQKEQLLEVYGVDSLKYLEIKDQISIDPNKIRKLPINTADFEVFKNHPYLTYRQINAIIQFRKQHGKYNNAEDLKKVAILTPQNIQDLLPYLVFQ